MNEKVNIEFSHILNSLQEYALVKDSSKNTFEYTLYFKPTMGFVMIEEHFDELVQLLLKKGIQVANSKDEIVPKDFRPHQMIWDEEKKEWKKIYEDEIAKILEEKRKNKTKK